MPSRPNLKKRKEALQMAEMILMGIIVLWIVAEVWSMNSENEDE